MSPPLDLADVLDRAADLLEPDGAWWPWALAVDADGQPCALPDATRRSIQGAILTICPAVFPFDAHGVYLPLRAVLAIPPGACVADWEHVPGRTQGEVVDALRAGARRAREGGA